MVAVIITILIGFTVIYSLGLLTDRQGIHITVHHIYESKQTPTPTLQTEEEKEQQQVIDGMTEVIRFTQEFLGGGEANAETERETK